jgi:ribosomal RNA-processing protein 7
LEDKINQELLDFEELELKMKKEALAKRNLPDEDGFVTVTRARGRRNTNRDGHGAVVSAVNPALVKDLKPKEKGLVDFYRFQMRENKRNQLIELRKRFEQDKLKIAELRKSRKFKPY